MQESNIADNEQIAVRSSNNVVLLDEVPVGGGNFNVSEYPQTGQPAQSKIYTMEMKLKSKAIKLKMEGFDELKNLIQENPLSQELDQIQLTKLLKQNNPACLQKALVCTLEWLRSCKQWSQNQIKAVIENGFINGKNNSKKISIQIVDVMFESKPSDVEETIIQGLKSKTPKIIGGYIGVVSELLNIYGVQKMKYLKPFLPDVVRVMNTEKLPIVKNEGINLLKSGYKWMGKEVVDAFLKDLKENIKKELDLFWETHNQSEVMCAAKQSCKSENTQVKGKAKGIDVYDISESVDIFREFDEKWADSVLSAEKWSIKVELLQKLIKKGVNKIASTEHRHVVEMIRRLLNDSNFNVILSALKVASVLAKGLRKNFNHSAKILFPMITNKFREKKNQMIQEVFNTLNEFYHAISLEDVIEDIKQALKDKVPSVKIHVVNWILKLVERKVEEKGELNDRTKDAIKNLWESFEKLLSDGACEVRDVMGKVLNRIRVILGEDAFIPLNKTMSKSTMNRSSYGESKQKKVSKSKQKRQAESAKKKSTIHAANYDSLDSRTGYRFKHSTSLLEDQSSYISSGDISDEVYKGIKKLNDNNFSWQQRKETVEYLIRMLENYEGKLAMNGLGEVISTLKSKLTDPNKHLIRLYAQLIGLVFKAMGQKDQKLHYRTLACALIEGLAEKMEANRKEIISTLQKIGQIVSQELILSIMAFYLGADSHYKGELLNYIIKYQQYLDRVEVKDYPKGIISCLCDKNRDIRNMGQHVFEVMVERLGVQVFRSLTRNQKPIYQTELNNFLDRYQPRKKLETSVIHTSRKNSPSQKKASNRKKSTLNNSLSKAKLDSNDRSMSQVSLICGSKSHFQPNDTNNFANIKTLSLQRIEREEKQQRYHSLTPLSNEQEYQVNIEKLFNPELSGKMFSHDYKKNIEASQRIVKLCKDISEHGNIREVYDLLLGWVLIKLWGGNVCLAQLIEVLPPLLSILQKKKVAVIDKTLDIILSIMKEYSISTSWQQTTNMDTLANIIKATILLSSGERTLKKMLLQFRYDVLSVHRHCRKDINTYYRNVLVKLICDNFSEVIINNQILEEIAKVKELADNANFIQLLTNKFHSSILEQFGFKNKTSMSNINVNHNILTNTTPYNSNISHNSSYTQNYTPSIRKPPTKPKTPSKNNTQLMSHNQSIEHYDSTTCKLSTEEYNHQIDMSSFMMPNLYSVLHDNLSKLKTQQPKHIHTAISFFTTLFGESGRKITDQLKDYSCVIFATAINALISSIKFRHESMPDKIISLAGLLQESIKCKHVFRHVGVGLLGKVFRFTVYQLVYEDEHRSYIQAEFRSRGIQYKTDSFIKAINGIMLRLLENSNPQQSINMLLSILIEGLPHVAPKKLGLLTKCITRVHNNYDPRSSENYQHLSEFFAVACRYLKETNVQLAEKGSKSQEGIMLVLRTLMKQLCQQLKANIWKYYYQSLGDDVDMGISNYMKQYTPQVPNTQSSSYKLSSILSSNFMGDEELRIINQLLSKSKTFKEGIARLKQYRERNKQFNITQYFKQMNYESSFINLVQQELQKTGVDGYVSSESLSSNINEKLKQLKIRFDGIQRDKSHGENLTPKTTKRDISKSIKNTNKSTEATDVRKRIDDMKKRVNYGSTNRIR